MAFDGTLKFDTAIDSSGFESGLSKISSLASKGLGAVGGLAKAAAGAMTAAGGAAIAFGTASVQTGLSFDQSMSQISATLGLTAEDIKNNVNGAGDTFDALRAKAQEMGESTNFTATQAADGLNILAMSGYDAEESMSMIEDVLHLAAAGSMDMGEAAAFVAGSMKGFGDETKDSAYYADIMAKGATLANTNVRNLGEAMADAASAAGQYGITAESTAVALLRLAEQGETGSAAGTALAAVMKNLYTPTDQAKKALEELGVAAFDSSGKARDINAVINDLEASMQGMTDEQKANYKQTIFGIQGLDAYNKMVVTSTEKQNEWMEALKGASGEAAQQYDTMTDNLQGDLDILNSAFDGLKLKISDELTPSMRGLAQAGTEMLGELTKAFEEGGFEGLAETGGEMLARILEGIAGKGPDIITTATSVIHSFCESLKNSENLTENGAALLGSIIEGIANSSLDLLDVALTLIEDLGNYLVENADTIDEKVTEFCGRLYELIKEHAPEITETAKTLVETLCEKMKEHLPEPVQSFCDAFMEKVGGTLQEDSTLLEVADIFQQIFGAISGADPEQAATLGDCIGTIVSWFMKLVDQYEPLHNFIHTVSENMPSILDVMSEASANWSQVWDDMAKSPGEVADNFNGMVTDLQNAFPGFTELVSTGAENAKQIYADLAKSPEQIVENFEQIKSDMGAAWEEFKTSTADTYESIKETAGEKLGAMAESFSEKTGEIIDGIVSWGSDMVDKGRQAAEDLAQAIIDAVTDLPAQMLGIGSDIVQGVWDGIQSNVGWFTSSVSGFFGGIVSNAKSVLNINSPSKVFRDQVGVAIPEGVAAGIDKAMPSATQDMKEKMKALAKEAENEIVAGMSGVSVGLTGGSAYDRAFAERNAQHDVNVRGTLQSDRPVVVNATLKVGKKEFAQEIAPEVNSALYTIDSRESRGVGR